MSATAVNTKVNLAVAAQESGDYASALTYLRSAQILLSAMPDSTGPGGSGMQYDRTSIDRMITALTKLNNASAARASGGIRRTKIEYVNPDCD